MPFAEDEFLPRNAGPFHLLEDTYLKGGLRVVADLVERDGITTQRQKEGMHVFVVSEGISYRLDGAPGSGSWVVADTGVILNRVVFRPGGPVNSGPVYNDFNTLKADVNSVGIPAIIDFDPEFATTEIPATGAPHVFNAPVFLWTRLTQGQFLQFENGASIQNVAEIRGAIVNILGATGGSAVKLHPGQIGLNLLDAFVQGARPLLEVPSVARVRLRNCDFDGGGSAKLDVSGFCILSLLGSSTVPANKIIGGGTVNFEVNADSDAGVQSSVTDNYTMKAPTEQGYTTLTSAGTLDGRRAYVFNSAAGFTQALPDPSRYRGPMHHKNIGAGLITYSGAVGTPATLAFGQSVVWHSDGTTWEGF